MQYQEQAQLLLLDILRIEVLSMLLFQMGFINVYYQLMEEYLSKH